MGQEPFLLGLVNKLNLNSATVCTLTVPVPSLVKGGGRHYGNCLCYGIVCR